MSHYPYASEPIFTTDSPYHNLPPPTLTWEQYILLNLELDRLSNSNKHLLAENEALKTVSNRNVQLIEENDKLRVSLANAEHEITLKKCDSRRTADLEIRIAALVKENQGFSSQLNIKLKDLDALQLKYEEMNEAAVRYSSLHDTRVAENEELQVQLLKMNSEIANVESLKNQLKQLTAQLKDLERARDELKSTLAKKEKENTELKQKAEAVKVVEMGEEERKALKDKYEDSQKLVKQLKTKVKEVEGQLALIVSEKEKTSTIVEDKVKEIEELKVTVSELSNMQDKIESLEKEKEQLRVTAKKKVHDYEKSKEEIKQLLLLGAHRHKEIERLKSQVFNLTQNEKMFNKEKDKLSGMLIQKTKEIEELKVEISYLMERNKNKCCSDASKSRHDQIQEDKEIKEYKNKMKRIADAERKLQGLLSENKRLASENDRISVLLIEKTKESEKFRERKGRFTLSTLTPKTSMASLGTDRVSFGELALQRIKEIDEPRKSAPLHEEYDGYLGGYDGKRGTSLADKDRVINQLSARVLDYERQLSSNGTKQQKRKAVSAEKTKFRRSNTTGSMKDLRVKTFNRVDSISEFSTIEEKRASKAERRKERLNTINNSQEQEPEAIRQMESEPVSRVPSPKKVVLVAADKERSHAPGKKAKSVREIKSSISQAAYTNGDQSDSTLQESPSRTSTVQLLTEEALSKRVEKMRETKKVKKSAELRKSKTSNFSFDAMTSPEASPLFDSKWF